MNYSAVFQHVCISWSNWVISIPMSFCALLGPVSTCLPLLHEVPDTLLWTLTQPHPTFSPNPCPVLYRKMLQCFLREYILVPVSHPPFSSPTQFPSSPASSGHYLKFRWTFTASTYEQEWTLILFRCAWLHITCWPTFPFILLQMYQDIILVFVAGLHSTVWRNMWLLTSILFFFRSSVSGLLVVPLPCLLWILSWVWVCRCLCDGLI